MSDAISTSNIWPAYAKGNIGTGKENNTGIMGKDDFLKILVAQMSNQDPTQPLQDREFIAQMAQFSSVEQIMNMATEMRMLRESIGMASGLIGKGVEWSELDDGTGVVTGYSGIVDAIVFRDNLQFAKVGEIDVRLDAITKIWNVTEQANPEQPDVPEVPAEQGEQP